MPPHTYAYTVFGFSENLDWSTLQFVKPIDDIRVCSACRVVAKKAAFLPCRHVLCEPCYKQWNPRAKVCFLDGELCPQNEVYWREFPLERMMKREVSCWNRENGCETIAEVSSLAEHFHRDCAYHSTCCPKCSSTVLRKDIVAHLQSHCVTHVLNRKCTGSPINGVSKEVVEVREGLRGIGLALRSYAHTNTIMPSTLQATHEENLKPLLTMAAEVKQVSLSMMEAITTVKASCQSSLNQAADLRTLEASLSRELEKLETAVAERGPCEATASSEKAELEEYFENLQLLREEIEVVSSKLREWRKRVDPEVGVVESVVAGGLLEARVSCKASSFCGEEISHGVTVRIFENALNVPVKVLCSVHRWSTSRHTNKECLRWAHEVESSVDDDRYRIHIFMHTFNKNAPVYIKVYVLQQVHAVAAKPPAKINLAFIDARRDQVEYDSDNRCPGRLNLRDGTVWGYLLWQFDVQNLEECVRIDKDQLRMCLTFSY